MSTTVTDAHFMARALQLARRGLYTTDPNPRVGCVIVKNGKIIGEGWHERAGQPHAEINALNQAGKQNTQNAELFVTLEPCNHQGRTPPCAPILIQSGIKRVVVAMKDPNPQVAGKGIQALESQGVDVDVGLMEQEAEALNPGFISRMKRGRPFVRVKLAASLDGRTAKADGESKWITSEGARRDVQKLRARSSAILTGVSTVLSDDPSLTVRDFKIGRQPLRVILDSRMRMPTNARILQAEGKCLIITASDDATLMQKLKKTGADVAHIATPQNAVDLVALIKHLAWLEVNEVLVESGATLCGALLRQGLVDELVLYYAPHVMGNRELGMFQMPPLARMSDRITTEVKDIRVVGKDWRVVVTVNNSE